VDEKRFITFITTIGNKYTLIISRTHPTNAYTRALINIAVFTAKTANINSSRFELAIRQSDSREQSYARKVKEKDGLNRALKTICRYPSVLCFIFVCYFCQKQVNCTRIIV